MKVQKVFEVAPITPFGKAVKADPFFERMKEFQDSMLQGVFDLFSPYPITNGRGLESTFHPETEYLAVPLEVKETEEAFVIHAELPGFKEKEIEVKVEPGRIFIGGKREEEVEEKKGKTVYSERTYKQVGRWFELPTTIEPENVKATLCEGVLEITLLKAVHAKKVPVLTKAA